MIVLVEEEGVIIFFDGRGFKLFKYFNGNWVVFIIIFNVIKDMKCYKEEIFGFVFVCFNVDMLDEVIDLINENEYGNGVVIFMRSGFMVEMFRCKIEVG